MLGLFFNSKLTWRDHFRHEICKASRRLYVLCILKSVLSHDQLIPVFNSLIYSLLDYASPVFLNAGSVLDSQLTALCKRAFRIIHGSFCRNCPHCSLPDVETRRKDLVTPWTVYSVYCTCTHSLLPQLSHRSNRLILPRAKTTRRITSFIFSCSEIYNSSLLTRQSTAIVSLISVYPLPFTYESYFYDNDFLDLPDFHWRSVMFLFLSILKMLINLILSIQNQFQLHRSTYCTLNIPFVHSTYHTYHISFSYSVVI